MFIQGPITGEVGNSYPNPAVRGFHGEGEGKQNKVIRSRGCGCASNVLAGPDIDH